MNKLYLNSIEFPEMNYKHFREKNAKFHIFLLLSIMGGISLITIYDRKFRHNRPEEGLPKIITYISPINIVAEDNHLYFAYKSPLGCVNFFHCINPLLPSISISNFPMGVATIYIYIYIYIYVSRETKRINLILYPKIRRKKEFRQ